MQLQRPFRLITPTVDGDVLTVLAGADASFTPPQVHQLLGERSEAGVRKALQRLVEHGLVTADRAGQAVLYRLNRDHIAAEPVIAIARSRQRLLVWIRDLVGQWEVPCAHVALFGSAARGAMRPDSDIDLLVVRPSSVTADDQVWRTQVAELEEQVSRWTGNDARVLELSTEEITHGADREILTVIRRESLPVWGSPDALRGRGARP